MPLSAAGEFRRREDPAWLRLPEAAEIGRSERHPRGQLRAGRPGRRPDAAHPELQLRRRGPRYVDATRRGGRGRLAAGASVYMLPARPPGLISEGSWVTEGAFWSGVD